MSFFRDHYLRLCVADKVRCVVSSLEELLQEIPWLLERLSDLIQFAETECDSVRYNFCFNLAVEKFVSSLFVTICTF
jgi:hypothetical protein